MDKKSTESYYRARCRTCGGQHNKDTHVSYIHLTPFHCQGCVFIMTWSPDLVTWHSTQLIWAIPQNHEFSWPHRCHQPQASPKTFDRSALHFHLRPSSLCKGLRSNISTKAIVLESTTLYYAESVTSYYAEGVNLYYAEDGTSYYAEVSTLYYVLGAHEII